MSHVLDYRTGKRPWKKATCAIVAIVSLFIGTFLLLIGVPYKVSEHRICQECGIKQSENYWFGLSALRTIDQRDTPVSAIVKTFPGMSGHAHRFIFLNENGYYLLGGFWCGLGSGETVLWSSTDPRAAALISQLYTSGQTALADTWRRRLLDKSTARAAEAEIEALDIPIQGFESAAEFATWQATHDVSLTPTLPAK